MPDNKSEEKGKVVFLLMLAIGVITVGYFIFVFLHPLG